MKIVKKKNALSFAVSAICLSSFASGVAAQQGSLAEEEIIVTAQKREQNIQEVPISISTLSGDNYEAIFSGGDDILALSARVPGLYAETSNGRVAPRFYIRGLGNTDFDLAASQPVSIVMDGIVKENVILKSFPLFDMEQVEVLRGPQGTLFGRNTTAGMVKFSSAKPTAETEGFVEAGIGSLGTTNLEAAISGGNEIIAGRFSFLSQGRDDYIDNGFTGESDVLGGYDELAWRAQVAYTPTDDLSALLSVYGRDFDGTSTIFRANALTKGSNSFNDSYDRDVVYFDDGDNNPQEYENEGFSLTVDYDFDGGITLTSITGYETADGRSKGDIDGGATFLDDNGDDASFPGFIPFGAVTEDQLRDLHQLTQEVRLASDDSEALSWQVGMFYFDSEFDIATIDGYFGTTTVRHGNTNAALFAQLDYDVNDKLNLAAGIRYTEDEKSLSVLEENVDGFALITGDATIQNIEDINVDDSQVSWELSANYTITDETSVYGRIANGFRAQTIQGRDVAFESDPSVADAETMQSFETGVKSVLFDALRISGALYYYQVDDMQFSAIGGDGNFTRLVNANKGIGQGFEGELEWFANEYLTFTAGFSYNDTEIDDPSLLVAPCGSGACTPLDPLDESGNAFVDGNPFPQAPKTIANLGVRLSIPVGDSGEFFAYTDWAFQGETNIFIYESAEFKTDSNKEGGLRLGYKNENHDYSVALFGRNITDEENLRGAIDFNNLTAIDNQPRIWGLEFRKGF